jgi:multiple sugar transport system substrate-binding protein
VPFLLVIAMAACGNAAANDVETIRFWGMGREGEVVAELIREFELEYPGVDVQAQQIPWTAAHEKLLTAHVGDAAPDVAQLGNTWIAEFSAIRALEPLDAWIAASATIDASDYFDGIWATNIVQDTVWGVPWYVDTRLVFYRSDILAAAGYDSLPQSWDGWMEAMHAVKRVIGPDRYPLFLPTNEWAQPAIFGLQNDAQLLTEDGHGAFSAPAFRDAFEFYLGLYHSGLAPAMGQYDVANPHQEFERGFFTMWITGPWNMGEFKRRLSPEVQDKWATAPLPGPTGVASGYSHAGGASLVMFAGSRHKDAAWKLIEFLSRPEQQQRFHELTGSLPARVETWERADLANDRYARAFREQLERVRPLPAVPEIESIMTALLQHAETAIRGGASADDVLRALDRTTDRILEKRRWMLAREAEAASAIAPDGRP